MQLNAPSTAATIDRGRYLLCGVALFALKFGIDWTVCQYGFHRPWSPAEYIAPGSSLALVFGVPAERRFYLTLLAIALPFIITGVALTAMRLRSVGVSAAWTVLFFVPGVNFFLFALLSQLPARKEIPTAAVAGDATPPAPHTGVAPALAYAPAEPHQPWLDRILPRDPLAAKVVATVVPVPVALFTTFASVHWLQTYGWGVFVGVPFVVGLLSAMLYAARSPRGKAGCIGVAASSLTLYGLALLLFAFEGAGCLIMAAPLAYPVALIGAAVGASLGARPTRMDDARRVARGMLLCLPLYTGAERLAAPGAPLYAVTSFVDIDASPDCVWGNVVGFGEIAPPAEWVFRTGVAYPVRAEIDGRGAGAVRRCVFSTGPFVEPITAWEEPRLLKFDVTSNPPPMKEWSPFAEVHPPHLQNFLVSRGGQFRLIPLSDGRTRLEGTTWYQHHMWPAEYWRLWSDFIIHRIHLRVLNHVKGLSEHAAMAPTVPG